MQHLLRHVEGIFDDAVRLPDGALIERFVRSRDEAAFAELLRRHGPMVWASCLRMIPRGDAEDAFQAVFLVLLKKAEKFTTSGSIGPWLHQVAVYVARNARRGRQYAALPEVERPGGTDAVDGRLDLDEALLGLAGKYREPLVLCHLQGLSRKEAAERLKISEGTLSSLLSRGLDKLRRKLPEYDPAFESPESPPVYLSRSTLRCAVAVPALGMLAANPVALSLSQGVLQMFLVKKMAAAGIAAAVIIAGLASGVAYTQQKGDPAKSGPPTVSGPSAAKQEKDDAAKQIEALQLAMEIRKLQDEKYACLVKQIELLRKGVQNGGIPASELIEPIREKALLACEMRAGLPELKADLEEYVKLAEGTYQAAKARHENGVAAASEMDKAKVAMLDAKILQLRHLGKKP